MNWLRSTAGLPWMSSVKLGLNVLTAATPPVVQRATINLSLPLPEYQFPAFRHVGLEPRAIRLAVILNEQIDANSLPPGSVFRVTARPRDAGRAVSTQCRRNKHRTNWCFYTSFFAAW